MHIDTTEGPLTSKILNLAWPAVLQALLVNFYAFNDYFFVGQLNDADATAALSACFALLLIKYVTIRIFPGGATTLMAQFTGAKQPKRVADIFRQALVVSTVWAMTLGVLAVTFMEPIVQIANVTDSVGTHVAAYLTILMIGAPAFALMVVVVGAFRSRGDTKTPLMLEGISLVVNTLLNYFFVLGGLGFPKWGIAGAALATMISRALPGVIGLVLIWRGHLGFSPKAPLHLWRPKWPDVQRMGFIGFFDSMAGLVYGIAYLVMNRMAGEIGPAAQGGLGVGLRGIEWIAFAISDGFMTAAITIVGQNVGAGKLKRAVRGAWVTALLSAVCCQAVATIFLIFPEQLCAVVTSDPETLRYAAQYVYLIGWFMWGVGFEMAMYGAFVGAGRTTVTFRLSLVCNLGRIPIAAGLLFGWENLWPALKWGVFGVGTAPALEGEFIAIGWAISATVVAKAMFYVVYFSIRKKF